jgi:hypothetical protein
MSMRTVQYSIRVLNDHLIGFAIQNCLALNILEMHRGIEMGEMNA